MSEEVSGLARGLLIAAGVSGVVVVALVAKIAFTIVQRLLSLIVPISTSKPKKDGKKASTKSAAQPQVQSSEQGGKERGPDLKTLIKQEQKNALKKGPPKDSNEAHHALFLNTLKGHADTVHSAAWSADGTNLVTACEDMMVRVFDMTDVTNREPKFKRIKAPKIPIGAGFGDSNDSVFVLMRGIPDAIMAGYGPAKQQGAPSGAFEQLWQAGNVHGKEQPMCMRGSAGGVGLGRRGVAISCSTKKDARVYNMQGRELAMLEPNSLTNHDLAVSADGRFVAVASFTAEVKIWELKWAKETGDFKGASKAMELKGHKSQVATVAFSPDNKRAVTASKDGTLRVWNIDVRYHLSEDAKTTLVIAMPLANGKVYQHMAFGPNNIIAASHEGTVHLLNANTGDLLDSIDAHDSTITMMEWCPRLVKTPGSAEPHAVLATSSRDKRVRLWRAP